MKRKKTTHIGFRIEDDVLERFDLIAEASGVKRTKILKSFMQAIVAQDADSSAAASGSMLLFEQLTKLDEFRNQVIALQEKLQETLLFTFEWLQGPSKAEELLYGSNEANEQAVHEKGDAETSDD